MKPSLLLSCLCGVVSMMTPHWDYDSRGPSVWPTLLPGYCAGRSQSPVNLDPATAVTPSTDPGAITFTGYDTKLDSEIINNGHSVSFSVKTGATSPSISGGHLPDNNTFRFQSLHWHWGSNTSRGSEHTLNGTQYPMEIHMIHWNTKYQNFTNSITHSDGLSVIGFFYEVSADDNDDLQPIIDKLSAVANKRVENSAKNKTKMSPTHIEYYGGSEYTNTSSSVIANITTPMSLNQFLPSLKAREEYFYYKGSLTTPMCNQVILWTFLKATRKVSEKQLAAFRSLKNKSGAVIVNNFRPTQPLNGRIISKRTASYATTITSSMLFNLSIFSLLMCMIVV